jgi:hypothetical protein
VEAWTERAVGVVSGSPEGLREVLRMMERALDHPILDEAAIPG